MYLYRCQLQVSSSRSRRPSGSHRPAKQPPRLGQGAVAAAVACKYSRYLPIGLVPEWSSPQAARLSQRDPSCSCRLKSPSSHPHLRFSRRAASLLFPPSFVPVLCVRLFDRSLDCAKRQRKKGKESGTEETPIPHNATSAPILSPALPYSRLAPWEAGPSLTKRPRAASCTRATSPPAVIVRFLRAFDPSAACLLDLCLTSLHAHFHLFLFCLPRHLRRQR